MTASPNDQPEVPPLPRYLQLLWGLDDVRRGPKPAFTIRDIGRAAVSVADAQGWEAASMKAIATELGVTTMSLYRYVDSKDDLLAVMLDEAFGRPSPDLTGSGDWRERLTSWSQAIAAVLVSRPWVVSMPMHRPPVTPNVLAWTDAGIRCFADTALSTQERFSSLLLVDGFIRNHVRQSDQLGALGAGKAEASGEPYEESLARLVRPETYPALWSALQGGMDSNDDDFFAEELTYGLEVLLDGLAQRIEGTRGRG
ncbi:TetR/AcrR family transcriptional regulator [Williamsia sterculiae]|uniref:Transcriptional regulator, TetR family n=1 Tax=Williamsia sterculiae TaxID=1344003 RepID=A0A1N7HDB8_9NOCA|nr:TetR/AcrR family transcriptional regulator [Williamsia sterculiae]SIS22763.1 transcriptional regulator, TetR family [Williamsia sterculiae]